MQTRRITAAAACVLACAGCSDTVADAGSGAPPIADAGLSGAESIAFTTDAILYIPGQTLPIGVQVKPAGRYSVRFSVVGDAGDSYLDRNGAETDAEGTAEVLLTTPSAPLSFRVRASVDSQVHAELAAEADRATGRLRVIPKYSGKRSSIITDWTATVHIPGDCATLPGVPPRDGTLVATGPMDSEIFLESVPVGRPLAVTVRAGHFAGGCANVSNLAAGGTSDVTVDVADARLRLDGPPLRVSMGVRSTTESLSALNGAIDALIDAAVAGTSSDVQLLLDDMEQAAGAATTDFASASTSGDWAARLAAEGPSALRADRMRLRMRQWLVDGSAKLLTNASLLATLTPVSDEEATFALTEVAGLDPASAGFTTPTSLTWAAEPDDTVGIRAELFLLGSQLLTELAAAEAVDAHPDTDGVAQALAGELPCATVSETLLEGAAEAYAGCGPDCLTALCESATRAAWERARTALNRPARLAITAAVAAAMNDEARLTGFVGEWVGAATGWLQGIDPEFEGSFVGVPEQ